MSANEIRLVGGTDKFRKFIRACLPEKLVSCATLKAAVARKGKCRAYLLLPAYEKGARCLPETDFETVEKFAALLREGQRLYIENYQAGDYTHSAVFGHIVDGGYRHFFTEAVVARNDWEKRLPDGNVMQARGSYYYPGRVMGYHTPWGNQVLLEAADVIGTQAVFREGTMRFPVLMKHHNFYCAAMNLSDFDPLKMLPVFRWRGVFAELFSQVLGVSKKNVQAAFDQTWQPIQTTGKTVPAKRDKPVREELENCVRRAVVWHERSGLLRGDATGRRGCFEMIRSSDLQVRSNLRMDSCLLTGLLYLRAGNYFGEKKWKNTGLNLVRFILDRGIQIEGGQCDGFLRWFEDLNVGPFTLYSSDMGRGGITLVNLHRLTGETEYLQRAVKLGDAFLRWLGKTGLLCGSFNPADGFSARQTKKHVTDNPVYYAEMTSFLLQLHQLTGEEKYVRAVRRYVGKIASRFPAVKPFGYSDNFTFSRFLLLATLSQEIAGMDLSSSINECLHLLQGVRHRSGGFGETPIRLTEHPEAGVGIGDGSDCIADLLYCNNFVLNALSIIARMKTPLAVEVPLARDMRDGLLKFWTSTQIASGEARLDGAWMRAYDMEHGEYYGLNKDKDWGAYCLMAGWMTGFVPLVMLGELDGYSPFLA